ncbi:hypothetical protein AB0M87_02705 [Streptomyces sp. NPDC051320]|uniref:hypothetical protein n=1 Tax=Streptomyces sp. NPDC051320 TaxID=3154644 RepID=UPI003440AEC7
MEDSTGISAVDTVVVWSLACAAIVAAIGVLWRLTRGFRRIMARVDDIVDDWQGVQPRPGIPGRPGVMARLGGIEARAAGIEERLGSVEHELHPNSGQSLRDAVDRVDVALNGSPPDPPEPP